MTAANTFKNDIQTWLIKNGFGKLGIDFAEDFQYVILQTGEFGISIGIQAQPKLGRYFEQFLYEYGLEYCGIFDPVLLFLHEVGHHMTYDCFTSSEKSLYNITKQFSHSEYEQERLDQYWSIPDEFAANMWEIEFINNHIDAVEELCQIYVIDWTTLCAEMNVWDLIEEG